MAHRHWRKNHQEKIKKRECPRESTGVGSPTLVNVLPIGRSISDSEGTFLIEIRLLPQIWCNNSAIPEFQRAVLDSLRQPLETGKVDVARANAHVSFPANVQLVAAMNPCRCGHLGDAALACSRAPRCAADYQSKVSGPMLDRIDLHVEVDPVSAADLALPPPAEGSAQVAARVSQARERQTARFDATKARTNADLEGDALERFATPDEAGRQLLMQAATAMRLSARSYTRMLRVARTIADLAGAEEVGRIHVAEALSYRRQAPRA